MSPPPITVTVLLRQIADWLTDAAALARAAATCAESGSEAEAVRLSLDLDERLHEAEGLHCAVRLIARLQADGPLPADASGLGIVLDAQPRSGDVPVRGSGRWRRPVSPPEARTSTMTHLTETQRRLIEAATHHPDRLLVPLPSLRGRAVARVATALLARGLAADGRAGRSGLAQRGRRTAHRPATGRRNQRSGEHRGKSV
jgi:hypothetical protein